MTTLEAASRLRLVNPKGTELPLTEFRMQDRSGGAGRQAPGVDGKLQGQCRPAAA